MKPNCAILGTQIDKARDAQAYNIMTSMVTTVQLIPNMCGFNRATVQISKYT